MCERLRKKFEKRVGEREREMGGGTERERVWPQRERYARWGSV